MLEIHDNGQGMTRGAACQPKVVWDSGRPQTARWHSAGRRGGCKQSAGWRDTGSRADSKVRQVGKFPFKLKTKTQSGRYGMINILIADDHELIREGLKKILKRESDMEVVARPRCSGSLSIGSKTEKPSIVLLDISMPGISGLDVLGVLRKQNPEIHGVDPEHASGRTGIRPRTLKAGEKTAGSSPRTTARLPNWSRRSGKPSAAASASTRTLPNNWPMIWEPTAPNRRTRACPNVNTRSCA